MSEIELIKINSENWREALALSVHVEQQEFVASVTPPVAIALAKAYIRPDGRVVEPYGIYNEKQMVGFFNLHYAPESKEDYWLFHFFIDKGFQRSGIGSKALNELFKHIKQTHPSCHRLRLTVHPENDAGKLFYIKLGFKDDSILTFGEPTYSKYI
ncbi:GNAT family N-acetyltransferase [Virgibacillus necropolis]|uniref:GNAT family N-acetyltransferase n=1 Tax=Virgibacillus necropolis TaxID=163877 RepID=UPI00384B11B0